MRKILLGTTAVVGAALLMPDTAVAQQAPTVRIGGYFIALYGNTRQNGNFSVNTSMNTIGASDAAANGGVVGAGAPAGPLATVPLIAGQSNSTGNTTASARLGEDDFSSDAEVHVFVNGKTANGLTYGAVIEIQFDAAEGAVRNEARRAITNKTTASIDEYYAFVASPRFGQVRFGDEDGPFGGLLSTGFVTNFGTGGVYGNWESFMVRGNRTTTSPGGVGDNTKIIYLSPQFFGFDFGVSFAPNEGEGEDTGCLNSFSSLNCDRAYAITNPASTARSHDLPGRLNEIQAAIRWRGNIAGVGIAANVATLQSSVIKNADAVTGAVTRTLRNPEVYQAGATLTAYGFTVGGSYMWGNTSFFFIPTARGDRDLTQWNLGASYTIGPFAIGANGFSGTNGQTGGPRALRGQRRWGYGIGANYTLAPGLDLVAEYVRHEVKQPGADQFPQTNFASDRAKGSVFLTGVRLAF